MKIQHSLCIVTLLAVSTFGNAQTPATPAAAVPAAGMDLPVSGWLVIGDKAKTFGPTEEAGKITFTGPDFGKKGKQSSGFFQKTDLTDGQTLEFSAKVSFTGVSGMGNFRFGIYQKRSKDHPRGWLGYCAFTGIDKKFPKGGLFASEPSNDDSFDKATSRVLGESLVPFKNIKDGSYLITMSLKRVGASIECTASLSTVAAPVTVFAKFSGTDAQPTTTSFDALGFTTHELLSADSFSLSEVSVKLITP